MEADDLKGLEDVATRIDAEVFGTSSSGEPGAKPGETPPSGEAKTGEWIPAPEKLASARRTCEMGVDLLAQVASRRWPCLAPGFDAKLKSEAVDKISPVLAKYDLESALLGRYKEEFTAGMFVAGVAWGMFKAVKAQQAQEQGGGDGTGQ